MKYKRRPIIWLCLLIITVSCSKKNKDSDKLVQDSIKAIATYTYLSEDGMYLYELKTLDSSQNENVILIEKNFNERFYLKRLPSLNGIKYNNPEGKTFWIKGNQFIFLDKEEKLSRGKLVKAVPSIIKNTDNTIYGTYVTSSYHKKSKGYDWVALTLTPAMEKKVKISVRSRADKKTPTCTFDGFAEITGRNQLKIYEDGMDVTLKVDGDSLCVLPQNKESADRLFFYCSGGATLTGKYSKIDGLPDSSQLDNTLYSKFLKYGDYGFSVTLKEDTLAILSLGVETDDPVILSLKGDILKSEIGDLNNDGFPELIIFEVTKNTNNFKKILGFSFNKDKSISMTGNLPDITNIDSLANGYRGGDKFSIVENTLVRRFPVYPENSTNSSKTGLMRQIQYKLVEGEAMRQFEIDKVVEY